MPNPTRWLPLLLVLVTALVPLAGTLFLGWSVREVLLLYWIENLVIGLWQIVKMARAPLTSSNRSFVGALVARGFLLVFFTVHYGGFCAGHGIFILILSSGERFPGNPFDSISLFSLAPGALLAIGTMFVTHGMATLRDIRARPNADASDFMVEPYKNIVVVHVGIVLGGIVAMATGNPVPVLVLIIIGKLILDWRGVTKAIKAEENGGQTSSSTV